MKISEKEYGTIIFSLEEYQAILEKEHDYATRNYVIDLIHKMCNIKKEESK